MKCLNLFKMEKIMDHPQIIVVLHSDVKILSGLRSLPDLTHCTADIEFGSHKTFIFVLNFINNAFGMNIGSIMVPLDGWQFGGTIVRSVVILEERLQLRMLLSRFVIVGGSSQSIQPFQSQFVVYSG